MRERHPVEIHLDLDEGASGGTTRRTRHVKGRRRHADAPPTVVAERVKPREQARTQRAVRRRHQRARGVVAAALGAVGVTVAVAMATSLTIPGMDQLTLVDDTAVMSPLPDSERRTRPPLSAPRTTDPVTASPSASPSPSATKKSTSATATTTKKKATTTKSASAKPAATAAARNVKPGVVLDGRRMGGWYGGASGIGVTDGSLSDWLNQPVTLAAFWADTEDEVQRTIPSLTSKYRDWDHAVDIAVGGTVLGSDENYAAAANGAYDERWRQAAKVIAQNRKGAKGPTFVRPFHEMNGSWYDNWIVTRENSADYKKAFARYAGILREALPEVYIAFSPNYGDHTGLPIDAWYPGDDVVDVIAPDYYNDYQDKANGSVEGWNAEADKRDGDGDPEGPEAWRQFAKAHGKPLAFPEWGLKPSGQGGQDSPAWIKGFNAWMNTHANTATWQMGEEIPKAAAGKLLYSAYFNVVHGGDASFTIFGAGANPNASSVFPTLKWGNNKAR